jgi:D-alanyl-D-alanine carboxypeptidase
MGTMSRGQFATLIVGAPLVSAAGMCGAAAQGLSARGRQAAEGILRGLVDKGAVPGVSYSIGNAHETLAVGAFGSRCLKPRLPMEAVTRCALASVSKQFASAAIYLLQERGAVSLQAPVATYVPEYRYGRQMTLALLLTMRAGVTANDEACEKPIDGKFNDKTLIANLNRHPLDFSPGRYFAYTNCGYDLLGVIVERVSHMPYARFIETNFFKPLGMRSSYVLGERTDDNFALGYAPEGNGWKSERATAADAAFASGNLVSTPSDMQRWDRSLLTAAILSRESLRRMFTVPTSAGTAHAHYASGWFVESSGVIWHGGTLSGYATANMLIPRTGHAITILGNAPPSKWRAEQTARAVYNASGLGPAIPPLAKFLRTTRPSAH